MNLNTFVKTASEQDIVKVAESIRKNMFAHYSHDLLPHIEKFAAENEGKKEEVKEPVNEAVVEDPGVLTPVNTNKDPQFQGKTDDGMANEKPTLDKAQLEAALKEAILTVNIKGLAQIIMGVREAFGDDMAGNAISVARQIMQDALVSGNLQKEQIAGLAQAFAAFEEGE